MRKKAEVLLRTVRGIGRGVALTILAEAPFIASIGRAREGAAFAGVTPTRQESGTSVRRRGRLSKEGRSALRTLLCSAALNVARRDNPLRSGYEAFEKRGKPRKFALGATVHRLLRIPYGVFKHETPIMEAFT